MHKLRTEVDMQSCVPTRGRTGARVRDSNLVLSLIEWKSCVLFIHFTGKGHPQIKNEELHQNTI